MDDPRASFFMRLIIALLATSGPVLRCPSHFRPRRIYGVAVRSFRVVSRRVAWINGVPSWWKSFVVPPRAWRACRGGGKKRLSNKWVYSVHLVVSRAGNSALITIIGRLSDGRPTSLIFRPRMERWLHRQTLFYSLQKIIKYILFLRLYIQKILVRNFITHLSPKALLLFHTWYFFTA